MSAQDASSIVQLLNAAERDPASAPEMFAQVYSQLRALARAYLHPQSPHQTLQATAIVHEAYIRLVRNQQVQWDAPAQFFAVAAAAMRSVLIDHARAKSRLKRGGNRQRVLLADAAVEIPQEPADFLKLDEGIQALATVAPDLAEVVRLRFFVGFDIAETAQALGISTATVKRRWQLARAWLYRQLEKGASSDDCA